VLSSSSVHLGSSLIISESSLSVYSSNLSVSGNLVMENSVLHFGLNGTNPISVSGCAIITNSTLVLDITDIDKFVRTNGKTSYDLVDYNCPSGGIDDLAVVQNGNGTSCYQPTTLAIRSSIVLQFTDTCGSDSVNSGVVVGISLVCALSVAAFFVGIAIYFKRRTAMEFDYYNDLSEQIAKDRRASAAAVAGSPWNADSKRFSLT